MSPQSKTADLGNRRAVLDEINALLEAGSGIDETRAKNVRKAIDALRSTDETPAAAEDPATEDPAAAAEPAGAPAAAESDLDAEIDAGLETLRVCIHKQVERRNRDYDKALTLTDELEAALKANELQQAERAYHKVMSIMGNIPGLSEQRWRDIDKRLNRVRPRLRKLESWRHWGTTQARQQLVDEVAKLKDAGLAPEKLARRIKEARAQWQAWDKSGDHAEKALWKAFDAACEEAYKPCIAHFDKLKATRAENLKQRRAVIDRLNARFEATDWKAPDWRELDRFVHQARRDFYKIGNVDFRRRKPLDKALAEALEKFEEHLERERARSLRAREKLITDIEALGEVASLREALDRLDALRKQWQVTVVGKRALENKLWKRFQAACDLTYRRRDAVHKEQDAERNENLKQKQALIEELDRTAQAGDTELLASASTLARCRDRWEEIGWVPRREEKRLDNRWRTALKQFRDALKAAQSRVRAAELDNLAGRAALCHRWEQTILTGGAIDREAVRAEWEALPALSEAAAAAIDERFVQAFERPADAALANNLARKQDACLKLEVMLELDSPPECKTERMAYQVERLNASLKKELDAQDSPADLLLTALTTGAVPPDVAPAIEQRITNCLARYRPQ